MDKDETKDLTLEDFKQLLKKQDEKIREGEDELIDAFRGI